MNCHVVIIRLSQYFMFPGYALSLINREWHVYISIVLYFICYIFLFCKFLLYWKQLRIANINFERCELMLKSILCGV